MFFQTTDDELISQIGAGSERAFQKLFERYSARVFGYCLRLVGDRQKAEDVAQEAWMKILKSAKSYKVQNRAPAWILTIARNCSWDYLRAQKNLVFDAQPVESETSFFDIENFIEQKNNLEKVKSAIDGLSENQRLIFVTWMTEKKSHEELALEFGTSVSAIKSLIFRARRNIEEKCRG